MPSSFHGPLLLAFSAFGCGTGASEPLRVEAPPLEAPALVRFSTVEQVVEDQHPWALEGDGPISCQLYFNMDSVSVVSMQFTPECWVMFPIRVANDSITVLWEPQIDTKYEFDVVRTIRAVGHEMDGRPFMRLSLRDDSTLSATYLERELIDGLNKSELEPLFFPDRFQVLYRDRP